MKKLIVMMLMCSSLGTMQAAILELSQPISPQPGQQSEPLVAEVGSSGQQAHPAGPVKPQPYGPLPQTQQAQTAGAVAQAQDAQQGSVAPEPVHPKPSERAGEIRREAEKKARAGNKKTSEETQQTSGSSGAVVVQAEREDGPYMLPFTPQQPMKQKFAGTPVRTMDNSLVNNAVWTPGSKAMGIPKDAIPGGWEKKEWGKSRDVKEGSKWVAKSPGKTKVLYVCRIFYKDGWQVGKLLEDGTCHISWGGKEYWFGGNYEVLIGSDMYDPKSSDLVWKGSRTAYKAVAGGTAQNDTVPVAVCRSQHDDFAAGGKTDVKYTGWHPGKLIRGKCNFGFGGKEIESDAYELLMKK